MELDFEELKSENVFNSIKLSFNYGLKYKGVD